MQSRKHSQDQVFIIVIFVVQTVLQMDPHVFLICPYHFHSIIFLLFLSLMSGPNLLLHSSYNVLPYPSASPYAINQNHHFYDLFYGLKSTLSYTEGQAAAPFLPKIVHLFICCHMELMMGIQCRLGFLQPKTTHTCPFV